jgi:hypothetical protein
MRGHNMMPQEPPLPISPKDRTGGGEPGAVRLPREYKRPSGRGHPFDEDIEAKDGGEEFF